MSKVIGHRLKVGVNAPLVSVIMPTHNRAALLPRAIESVLTQSYRNFEFIIVNDASTDTTGEVIKKYEEKDNRISHVTNSVNLRVQKSLNLGLALAKGDYIARVDDDDIWSDPKKLEKQIVFLETHPDYVLVGTNSVAIFQKKGLRLISQKPITDAEIRDRMLLGCPFLHPSVVYRKSAIAAVGPYDERLTQAEDYDLWMRFGKIGKLYNLPETAVESLIGETNLGQIKRKEILAHNLILIRRYRRDYPHFFLAFAKNYLEYLDASWPILRKIFWPVYKIRRFLIDRFGRDVKVSKL